MFSFLKSLFSIDSKKVKSYINDGAVLIDVRTPHEFDFHSIKSSRNVPLSRFKALISSFDKNSKYIVYCKSGMRSSQAVSILKKAGFQNVVNGKQISKIEKLISK